MITTVATAKDRYLAEFEALERRGAFRSPSSLAPPPRRAPRPPPRGGGGRGPRAIDRFAESGFPSTRDEDWRYTNLTSFAATPFQLTAPSPAGVPDGALERLGPPRVEWPTPGLVDGRGSPNV